MKYIAYCRKSSESEDRQVLSIQAQIDEMQIKAAKDGVVFDKMFTESKSAKEPGRPQLKEMVEYIQKNAPCTLYVWKLDRLARNPIDAGQISWLLQSGVIQEVKTYDKSFYPTDNVLFMSFEFGSANQFIRDLSANVKRGNLKKLKNGIWPGSAPFGYLNDKAEHTIYIDDTNAHYVKKMFELYSTGIYGVKDIEKILHDEGLRSKTGRKVRHSSIHRIINNPFYCGIMVRDGVYYPAKHEPIVSKHLFDLVQQVIQNRKHTHKEKHVFVHRGFIRCNNCDCQYTASLKKGFTYYYCTNGKGHCTEHREYLREEKAHDIIADILNDLRIDEELIELAYLAKKEKVGQTVEYARLSTESIQKQIDFVSQKQAKLLDSHLSNLISDEIYKEKILALNNEKTSLEQQKIEVLKQQPEDPLITLERIKTIFLKGNQAKKDFLNAKNGEKRKLLEIVLWNVKMSEQKIAEVSFKDPYNLIAKTTQKGDLATVQWGYEKLRTDFMGPE